MTITIAKLLDRKMYDVQFVVIGNQIGEIKNYVPVGSPLSLLKVRNIFDFTTIRVFYFLKKLKPQYVFCSLHYLNPRIIIAAKCVGGCKAIVRLNCAVNRVVGINKKLTQLSYPVADVIIAQTEQMEQELETTYNLPRGKVITLHNLIDEDSISVNLLNVENPYENEKRKKFVWVGRYDRVKGADIAVEAFAQAKKINNDICLFLVGKIDETNEYYQSVKRMVEEKGLTSSVVFAGFQVNPYKWMKFADCFVLSSRSEGSPNALFEAIYLGVPAVATRCTPNIDDIIKDGVNGYVSSIGDYSAMASAMIMALEIKDVKIIYNHSTSDDFKALFA